MCALTVAGARCGEFVLAFREFASRTDPLHALLMRVRELKVDGGDAINPFWIDELRPLKEALAENAGLDAPAIQRLLGYVSAPLGPGESNAALFNKLLRIGRREALPKQDIEHATGLKFLYRVGVLDEYYRIADSHGLRSSMTLTRHFWYARELARVLDSMSKRRPCAFLEIGAGGGQFAFFNSLGGRVSHYVIVDLPAMMINSMTMLMERFPEAEFHFDETPDFSASGLAFWFLDTRDIARVPDQSVDVAANFNSFMEMAEDVRNFYFDEIYRVARPGALFYNVNKRQERMTTGDGRTYDNHPLLYPYRTTDRVIEWQPDPFQQSLKSGWLVAPMGSFAISRIAEIA